MATGPNYYYYCRYIRVCLRTINRHAGWVGFIARFVYAINLHDKNTGSRRAAVNNTVHTAGAG